MTNNEAQKILDMIENVDPSDTDTLDEIDARVWCFINQKEINGISGRYVRHHAHNNKETKELHTIVSTEYTRSRDASMSIKTNNGVYLWVSKAAGNSPYFYRPEHKLWGTFVITHWTRPLIPTENLAYLHGKIQTLIYEEKKDQKQ